MILGSICVALACLAGLTAMLAPRRRLHPTGNALIRASTLSPVEWQVYRRQQADWFQRWLRPTAMLLGARLHLRPARLDPLYLIQAGVDPARVDGLEFRVIRLICAAAGGAIASLLSLLVSSGLVLVPALTWVGYITPARILALRRRRRQDAVYRELPQVISMIRAFSSAGLPLERTLHILTTGHAPEESVLRDEIRQALGRYGLGISIEEAIQEIGPRTGVDEVTMFTAALAQAKRTGAGLEATLRDHELMARMNARNRATTQAAAVSTKLLGVLAGIYLPEFVILIMAPLFWGIMRRAFG
jgi:Flp pilus assembly protein TadB